MELVGDDSPEADAEVVALAISSLQAAGVKSFKIAMGHVGFLDGLFQEAVAGLPEAQEELKSHLLNRDYVAFRETLRRLDLTEAQKRELDGLLRLRGGKEICGQALELSSHPLARTSIEHLCKVWEVLVSYGVSQHVLIDLTMIGDFSYYTGMTFEGYASELGFPVCSGGRYDNLLQQFGRPIPSTGFSLKTNRILDGVSGMPEEVERPVLIQYDALRRTEGLEEAARLRAQGRIVVTKLAAGPEELKTVKRLDTETVEAGGEQYGEIYTFVSFVSEHG